jgi:hypothetical protein
VGQAGVGGEIGDDRFSRRRRHNSKKLLAQQKGRGKSFDQKTDSAEWRGDESEGALGENARRGEVMKKMIINFYFLVFLGLIAQAVFVVVAGNATVASRLKFNKISEENQQLEARASLLRNRIATSKALANLEGQEQSGYVEITKLIEVYSKQTQVARASLE